MPALFAPALSISDRSKQLLEEGGTRLAPAAPAIATSIAPISNTPPFPEEYNNTQQSSGKYLSPVTPAKQEIAPVGQTPLTNMQKYAGAAEKGVAYGSSVSSPETMTEAVSGTLAAGAAGAASGAAAAGPWGAVAGGAAGLVIGGLNSFLNLSKNRRASAKANKEAKIAADRQAKLDAQNEKVNEHNMLIQDENLKLSKETFAQNREQQAYTNALNALNSKLPNIQKYMESEDANRSRFYKTGMV
jgi:hypothetical protein